jgi:hypothetical protein
MKKKIVIFSTIIVAIIVIGSCSSSIIASNIEEIPSNENIKILVNQFYSTKPKTIETTVNFEDAEEIKQILINLNEAITNSDKVAISYYEKQLNDKGIFGEKYQNFFSNDEVVQKLESYKRLDMLSLPITTNDDNISNSLCFLNAIGKGIMVSYFGVKLWEAFQRIVRNASSVIEAFILILIFLPFVALGILLTSLIPIRIAMPRGMIYLEEGRISSIGLQGFKREEVSGESLSVNISWFTGLSINIPGNNETGRDSFMFVSGFAVDVKPYQS